MSGETESRPSSWTIDSLKEHVEVTRVEMDRRYEQRFEAQEKAVLAALTAAKEAVIKAEVAAEKRADAANEFRGQLADQAATLMPRSETTLMFDALRDRVDKLESTTDRTAGQRKGLADSWGYLVGIVALAGGVIAIILAFN